MAARFYELAIGARFKFRGRRYEKVAMSLARDIWGWANILQGETVVESKGPFLAAEVASRWKPVQKLRDES